MPLKDDNTANTKFKIKDTDIELAGIKISPPNILFIILKEEDFLKLGDSEIHIISEKDGVSAYWGAGKLIKWRLYRTWDVNNNYVKLDLSPLVETYEDFIKFYQDK